MDNHHNHNNGNFDKSLFSAGSDFDKEAKDGWDKIGMENWDDIQQRLSSKIDGMITKESSPVKPTKTRKITAASYGIAAMIMIVLGLSIKLIYNDRPENIVLFENYYKPLNAPEDTFRGEEKLNEAEEKARLASDAYDDLEFKKSIAFYSELLKEFPNNSKYTLFLGLSYINDGKYEDAIVLYNGYKPQGISYDEDIQWYLALAHLRKGEVQTSRLLLQNIANNSQSYYSETATELVSKMTRLK